MQEREILLMESMAFENVSFEIQIHLFMLFQPPKCLRGLPTWLCILCTIFMQVPYYHVTCSSIIISLVVK